MRSLFLSSIAVLFLATGTAHAEETSPEKCLCEGRRRNFACISEPTPELVAALRKRFLNAMMQSGKGRIYFEPFCQLAPAISGRGLFRTVIPRIRDRLVSSREIGKALIFTPVRESSGECRICRAG